MNGISLLAALKAFDATARLGSMTQAAKQLGLQQPTVSAHVLRLEQEFGVELFHRRGRRLELSGFGGLLLEQTRRVFSGEEDAQALLLAARQHYVGRLQIHAIGPYNVLPILKHYRQRMPNVNLSVAVADSQTILSRILDWRGDVGIVLGAPVDSQLFRMPLRKQALVVFCHKHHPLAAKPAITMKDLAGQGLVCREEGSTTRRVFEQTLRKHQVTMRTVLEMGSREAVREAVAQGFGIGVVAEPAYIADERLVQLPLTDATMHTEVHVVCRQERSQVPLIQAFIEAARLFSKDPHRPEWG